MNLDLVRYSGEKDDTLGLFLINCDFQAYTLEDEYREEKVMGETRIPAGTYSIKFRKVGGFHNRYLKKYGEVFHKGMLELQDVPNFKYVLIHSGNDESHTAGCILLGDTSQQNITKNGFIGGSVNAYKRVYPQIAKALENGEEVNLTIRDL